MEEPIDLETAQMYIVKGDGEKIMLILYNPRLVEAFQDRAGFCMELTALGAVAMAKDLLTMVNTD